MDCYYDGGITDQALDIRAAAQEVEAAKADLDAIIDRYDLAKQSCIILQAGNDQLDAQLEARSSPGVRKLGGLGLYLLTRWCDALGATRAQALTEGRPSLTVRLPIR